MRARAAVCAALCVAWAALPTAAHAQQRGARPPLEQMTDDELREYGFQWEDSVSNQGSLAGGVIAAVGGAVWRGAGHFFIEESSTGWQLLLTEVSSLVLIGGALLVFVNADGSVAAEEIGLGLGQIGGGLFFSSYLVDIIGSVKGSRNVLAEPIFNTQLLELGAEYRFVSSSDLTGLVNVLDIDAEVDLDFLLIEAGVELDARLLYRQLDVGVALKPVEGRNAYDYLMLKVALEGASFDPSILPGDGDVSPDNAVLRGEFEVELSLDLGQLIPHMTGAINLMSLGVGFGADAGDRAALPGGRNPVYVTFQNRLHVPVSKGVALEPYYIFSEAELLAPINTFIGYFGARLRVTPRSDLEVFVDGAGGDGFQLGAGVQYTFF